MDTILNYLDNMFVNFIQTPEVLRAKEDLAEMMEDKYNELIAEGKMENEAIGIVISEFGNIQELMDELGLENKKKEEKNKVNLEKKDQEEKNDEQKNTYYFEKKEWDAQDDDRRFKEKYKYEEDTKMKYVSGFEAEEYLFAVKQSASKIATGVFLCICSPVLLILLYGLRYTVYLSNKIIFGLGITILLIMVAEAVGLFISASMKLEAYEYLKSECFILEEEFEIKALNMQESKKGKFTSKIIIGVMLLILSAIPVILMALMNVDILMYIAIAVLLVIVGIAVSLFITAGMEEESYKVILQKNEYSKNRKAGNKVENIISAIYWPVVLCFYFLWSFRSGNWHITWLIWPLSAAIFGVVCQIIENTKKETEESI